MDRGRGLDLCTGSVYWICVLCTVYWICVLCTVPVQLYSCSPYGSAESAPAAYGRRPAYGYGAVKVPPQRTAVPLRG